MIQETELGWLVESDSGTGVFARSHRADGTSQDVSLSVPDREDTLRAVAEASGWAGHGDIFGMTQVHGKSVLNVDGADARGLPQCDALVGFQNPGLLTGVTADCVPIIVFGNEAVSVIHAGWRGLAVGVIAEAVIALSDLSSQNPDSFQAFVGPSAGACCYEVGLEVLDAIGGTAVARGMNLSSSDTAISQLTGAGIERIECVDVCTICSDSLVLNSYRRQGDDAGRQGVLAWLNS